MSCGCIEIRPKNLKLNVGTKISDFTFDLFDGKSEIQLFKTFEKVQHNGNITRKETSLGFKIPDTTKNSIFIEPFLVPSHLNAPHIALIPVTVKAANEIVDVDTLIIKSHSDIKPSGYEVVLTNQDVYWFRLMQDVKLNQLSWDDFVFDFATVQNIMDNGAAHVDGTPPYYFAPLDFGGTIEQDNMRYQDLRTLLNVRFAILDFFCNNGFEFICPTLETDAARRLWMYVLRSDLTEGQEFGVTPITHLQIDFDDSFGNFGAGGTFIVFPDGIVANTSATPNSLVISDPLSQWDTVATNWTNLQPFTVSLFLEYTMVFFNGTASTGFVNVTVFNITDSVTLHSASFPIGAVQEITANMITPIFTIEPNKQIQIRINPSLTPATQILLRKVSASDPNVVTDVKFIYDGLILDGDTISIKNQIVPSYRLSQVFGDIAMMFQWVFITDFERMRVTALPYQKSITLWDGTELESYWIFPTVGGVATPKVSDELEVKCDSRVITSALNSNAKRFYRVGFKSSTDNFINKQELEVPDPLYTRKIDLGKDLQLKEETQEIRLKFFEPSALRIVDDLVGISGEPPILTVMHDEDVDEGKISKKIAPRLLFAFGGNVSFLNAENLVTRNLMFESSSLGSYAYVAHAIPELLSSFIPNLNTITSGVSLEVNFETNLTFAILNKNLVQLLWLDSLNDVIRALKVTYDIRLDGNLYNALALRSFLQVSYKGDTDLVKPLLVSSYYPCLDNYSKVTGYLEQARTSPSGCNAPCDCCFEECTYFNSLIFGITQGQLDNLTITSVKIQGIEQISSPIGFGTLDIEVINGVSRIKNMETAINSLALPFITAVGVVRIGADFEGSYTRIKHPACELFEIIVFDNTLGQPSFRITQSNTQGFSLGSFTTFNINGELQTKFDCLTTQEII